MKTVGCEQEAGHGLFFFLRTCIQVLCVWLLKDMFENCYAPGREKKTKKIAVNL